jgi:hypothetical protein
VKGVIDMASDDPYKSAASSADGIAGLVGVEEAVRALKRGPIGAYVVASIAVGLLFIGWLAFYFLLFMQRGPIG